MDVNPLLLPYRVLCMSVKLCDCSILSPMVIEFIISELGSIVMFQKLEYKGDTFI